jgi:type I restriction enzyme S subunit
MVLFRLHPGFATNFVMVVLNSPVGRKQAEALAVGTAHPHINLGDVKAIQIPIPPAVEQMRITQEVERRLSLVEKLEAVVEVAQKRAAALRQSILKRAFEGKLVAQDPDDEPADVLLERIRGERAAVSTNGNTAKRAVGKKVRA